MTGRHVDDARLQDYVDGALSRRDRQTVEQHLATCNACAAERDAYRALRESLAGLPHSVTPPTDGWPALRERLDTPAPAVIELPRRRDPLRVFGYALAAAAALAIAFTVLRPEPEPDTGAPMADAAGRDRGLPALETECRGMGRELMAVFAARGTTLDPEVSERITHDLNLLDRAIDETRSALEEDPGNRRLQARLRTRHEQKLALMGRLVRIARIA